MIENNRVVIVGGVAGGMSTATRLRRLDAERHHHRPRAVRACVVRQLRAALLRRWSHRRGGGPHPPDPRAALRPLSTRRQGQPGGGRDRPGGRHGPDPVDDQRPGDRRRLRQARPQHGSGAGAAADPRLRPGADAADRRGRRPPGLRRRCRAEDGGRDRRRLHRPGDGREPRRTGHSRSPSSRPPRRSCLRSIRSSPILVRDELVAHGVARRDRGDGRLGGGAIGHPRRRPGPCRRPRRRRDRSPAGRPPGRTGRTRPRTERRHRGQRDEPDQRSRHLRRRRCRREARCDLARDLAHRPGQRRQPPGSAGGRPHRRATVADGAVPRNGHREGVRPRRRHRRVERTTPARPPAARSGRSTHTRSTTPPTTRGRRAWRRS